MTSTTLIDRDRPASTSPEVIFRAENICVAYEDIPVLENITLDIYKHQITGFIGPSGCGKSTLLRCFNRLNELVRGAKTTGTVSLYDRDINSFHPVEVRRRIGMVFQRPNPFPKSVYDNIAVGLRVNGYRGDIDERVETALRQVGLWNEVKQNLKKNAWDLSGGQQQRLCIARAIALQPEAILMDEPCASLDPISSARIDELLCEMKQHYTIIIVTHNLKQAARITDRIAFFNVEAWESDDRLETLSSLTHKNVPLGYRVGRLIEYAPTVEIFTRPQHQVTLDYLSPGTHQHSSSHSRDRQY